MGFRNWSVIGMLPHTKILSIDVLLSRRDKTVYLINMFTQKLIFRLNSQREIDTIYKVIKGQKTMGFLSASVIVTLSGRKFV